ncbi:MAG TPA: pyrroline-5-carboxylate reductase [Geobacteraceae bacterium]
MLTYKKIGFIGGGNMAEALIKGLHAGGFPASDITVAEPVEDRRRFLNDRYGITVTSDNTVVATSCDVIILAIKPQMVAPVLAQVAPALVSGTRLISIMAGVKSSAIEAAVPTGVRVVRVMPNTPALVLEGATAICAGKSASDEDVNLARRIFDLVGKTWQVDEKLMDAVTGLSGSGPAYVLTIIEALSDAGVKNGIPRDVAAGLAAQTVFGTAKLLLETREHPAVLRDKVTSPGGTTIAGLHVMERKGVRGTLMNAVDAATARSKELGGS